MATISFTGLTSGIDWTSVIDQLMEVERAPQDKLKTQLTTSQTRLTALQSLNTAFASLRTAANDLSGSTTWNQLSASSSVTGVSATAGTGATAGSYSVTVNQLATSAKATATAGNFTVGQSYTLSSVVGGSVSAFKDSDDNAISITAKQKDGAAAGTVDVKDLATQINSSTTTTGLSATVVTGSDGEHLVVTSTKTGDESNFKIGAVANTYTGGGSGQVVTKGVDASITIDGIEATSKSNTFTGVVDGLDITISADKDGNGNPLTATLTVGADASARADSVQKFVDQINAIITQIADATNMGTATQNSDGTYSSTGAGDLAGESMLRTLSNTLLNTVYSSATQGLDGLGISVDEDGLLTFDADTFNAAYAKDPTAVDQAIVGNGGFSDRVYQVASSASNYSTGTVSLLISSENSTIDSLNDSISAWDNRLTQRQAYLEQVYTNLEVQLSQLQSTSSWLTDQLDSLDSGWG